MKTSRFVKLLLGLSLGGFLVLVCLGGLVAFRLLSRSIFGAGVTRSGPMLNRIAYVGNDGNLWLVVPDKEEITRITTDGRGYRFPTWAPDGRRLAFIGPDNEGDTALYVYDAGQQEQAVLFGNSDAAPFYVYWSPDSRAVTFLTQEPSDLAMRLVDAEYPDNGRILATGSPFYWVWSPEANQLFMHVGGSRAFSEDAHISFLGNGPDAARVELKLAPGRFQAPTWSQSGQYVFYVAAADSGQEAIYRTDVNTSQQTLIATLDGPAFITLAPDDGHIAYLQVRSGRQAPALGTAYVIDAEGQNERPILEEWAAAMYWSPDGKKLALLTLAQDDESPTARAPGLAAPSLTHQRFRWWIYDLEKETLDLLISFVPTLDFLQTVPYFDQYHLSLTFWSPDSRYLVSTQRDASGPDGTVWILDTTREEPPRRVGEGTLAVWSWR